MESLADGAFGPPRAAARGGARRRGCGAEMTEGERGSFRYTNPAVIHYGAGCVAERLDAELERLGARRAFLVTTRSVAANPALAGWLAERLGERLVGRHGEIGAHAPAR